MNEVKAFIRKRKAEEVIDALEEKGFCCMTLMDVMGIGRMSDPEKTQISVRIAERFTDIAKLVVVCEEEDTDQVMQTIRNKAHSGQPGDGIIYATPVLQAMHIRTGEKGCQFLQNPRSGNQ